MRLAALDLNLLVPLEALLRLRNVTHAANEVGLSQPAMSSALRRLRLHFGDELLARVGTSYQLTPLAQRLVDDLQLALEFAARTMNASPSFEPASSRRAFTIVISDYALLVLGAALVSRVASKAPGVTLAFEAISAAAVDDMDVLLNSKDLIVFPRGYLTLSSSEDLFDDRWVCLVSHENTVIGEVMTEDDIDRVGWVVMYARPTAYTPADRALDIGHPNRRVDVVVESFADVPLMVGATRGVALIQQRLAERLAPLAPHRILACPVAIEPLHEAMWWHSRHALDPAHVWLRRQLADAAAELRSSAGAPV